MRIRCQNDQLALNNRSLNIQINDLKGKNKVLKSQCAKEKAEKADQLKEFQRNSGRT